MNMLVRVLGVLVGSAIAAAQAVAQTYPDRPIRIIVPQSAGGSTDQVARPLAKQMAEIFKQGVIVDNRPGAGSVIGTDAVAKAAPDGYTLLVVAASFSMSPSLQKNLPFDPERSFAPISLLSSLPNILVVHPSVPVKTLKEFVAYAKANPGKLNYGSSGIATGTHMSMELLKHQTGIDLVHVPFKGGAPSVNALLGNQIQAALATISTALPHVKAGTLRALGVTTLQRSVAAPEVPTIDEAGVKGYDYSSWIGLLAPAKTPAPIIAQLQTVAARIVRTEEMRKILALEGADPVGGSPEEFARVIRSEVERWKTIAAAAGIKAE